MTAVAVAVIKNGANTLPMFPLMANVIASEIEVQTPFSTYQKLIRSPAESPPMVIWYRPTPAYGPKGGVEMMVR